MTRSVTVQHAADFKYLQDPEDSIPRVVLSQLERRYGATIRINKKKRA